MSKRIAVGLVVAACLYLGVVIVALPLLEHTFGLGVYRKGHGYAG